MHFKSGPTLEAPLSTSPPLLCIPASKSPKYPPLTPGWSLYNSLTLPNPTILLFVCCKCQAPRSTPQHNVKIQFLMHHSDFLKE